MQQLGVDVIIEMKWAKLRQPDGEKKSHKYINQKKYVSMCQNTSHLFLLERNNVYPKVNTSTMWCFWNIFEYASWAWWEKTA